MADTTSDNSIDQLLAERAQYEQWLARLDTARAATPDGVRQRVRQDYEGRLQGVIERLRGHAASIAEDLGRQRTALTELEGQEAATRDALAEAEIRHAVGEFGDAEWERISGASTAALAELTSSLDGVRAEIARLTEVQSLIQAPAPPVAAAPAPAPSPAVPAQAPAAASPAASAAAPPGPPRFTPRGSSGTSGRQGGVAASGERPAVDELAFLNSLAPEGAPAPRKPAAGAPAAPPAPSVPAARKPDTGLIQTFEAPADPEPLTPEPPPTEETGRAGGGTSTPTPAKTLRCGECGTLNRPTEWYCERCGAELAAL